MVVATGTGTGTEEFWFDAETVVTDGRDVGDPFTLHQKRETISERSRGCSSFDSFNLARIEIGRM